MAKKKHKKKGSCSGPAIPTAQMSNSYPPLPEAFCSRIREMLPAEEAEAFFSSYDAPPLHALRLRPDKAPETAARLTEGLSPVPWESNGRIYPAASSDQGRSSISSADVRLTPGKSPFHEAGLYYIQEPSAMLPAALLHAERHHRVLDLCAAPGGKSTQLASALSADGLLVANEPIPSRAKILSENIERMGAANVIVTQEWPSALAERLPTFFDAVLVDAPCSGEGMFRRNPAARAEWTPDSPALCAARDDEILDAADVLLAPGGRLVFSTCTFAPEENEGSILRFLTRHPDYRLVPVSSLTDPSVKGSALPADVLKHFSLGTAQTPAEEIPQALYEDMIYCVRLWPHRVPGEGHFAAVLEKASQVSPAPFEVNPEEACGPADPADGGSSSPSMEQPHFAEDESRISRSSSKNPGLTAVRLQQALRPLGKPVSAAAEAFLREHLNHEALRRLLSVHGSAAAFGGQIYLLPKDAPSLEGLHVLRPGLHLCTIREGSVLRTVPAHALALSISAADALSSVEITPEEALRWIRGEILPAESALRPDPPSGDCLVSVAGASLGWGRIVEGTIKNRYPKGLRKSL